MVLDNAFEPDPRVLKEVQALSDTYDITILAWDRQGSLPAHEVVSGARIERLVVRSSNSRGLGQLLPTVRFWFAAARRLRKLPADLVHCHDLPSLLPGVVGSIGRRIPIIFDAHELYWLQMRTRLPRAALSLLRQLELALLKKVAVVVTVNSKLATYYSRKKRAAVVVGNWYDPVSLDEDKRQTVRAELGISAEQFCVLYVGAMGPERLLTPLLDAANSNEENLQIVIAGRGPGASEVEARLPNPHLHWLGWTNDADSLYSAADAIYYGLDPNDPYAAISSPNALFKAIAWGIPLITTATSETQEIIARSGGGVVLKGTSGSDVIDAIRWLRETDANLDARKAMADLQKTYSWRIAAEKLRQAYTELLGSGNSD
jgi:glycosyltransferase involved in cell wall biosynthesis